MSQIKEWLVKSAGEIKGPYTFDEVVERIQTKEIILVDEVAKSFGRWRYVRDEGVFEKVVLELKNREESRGEKTFTNSDTDAITQDVADHVVNFSSSSQIKNQIQDHFKKSEEKTEQKKSEKQSQYEEVQVKSYAYEKDREVQKDLKKTRTIQILGVLLVLISIIGFIFIQNKSTFVSYDDLKKTAVRSFELGQFQQAKLLFEKLVAQNPSDDEIKYMSAYNNLYLGDTIIAEKMLSELKEKNSRYQNQVYNLLGIIQLKNYNLSEAKTYFEDALKLSPQFVPSFYNKGIVDFLENRFLESHQNFSLSMVHGGLDGVILLMNVELLANSGRLIMEEPEFKSRANEIRSLLRKHIQSFEIYKQELLIGLAVINHFLGQIDEIDKNLEMAINVDPDQTQNHIFDISFYRDVMTWNRIHGWIKLLKEQYPRQENLSTLYGYSLFKGTEKIEGKSYIEGRLDPNFKHPIDHILNAYILWSLGRDAEAEVALMSIPTPSWNPIAHNLKAKICFKKADYECAQKSYEASLVLRKSNIVSLSGLSAVFLKIGNRMLAKDAIAEAYRISPHFKPTLDIKYEMEFKK